VLPVPKTQFTGIGIHIKVADIHASRKFYEDVGFVPVFGYGDDEFRASLPDGCESAPEDYRGVTYRLTDNAELEVADGHRAVKAEVFSEVITTPKISGMIRVRSLVPVLERIASNLHFPVRKYYWGSIEAAVRDPDGFVLIFIAPYTDEEFAAVGRLVNVEVVDKSS
jgi:hypothetical protein